MITDNVILGYIIQIITSAIGAVCFSIWYNIRGYRLILIAFGSAITWCSFLINFHFWNDKILSLFFATVIAAISSEILARIIKAPVLVLLVPMLIPLIPGGDLYYTTLNLVSQNMEAFSTTSSLLAQETGAIAFAIILVTCFAQVINKILKYNKAQKN